MKRTQLATLILFVLLASLLASMFSTGIKASPIAEPETAIWIHYDEVTSGNLDTLVSHGIDYVFVQTGDWQLDHTIDYYISSGNIATMMSLIHSKGLIGMPWIANYGPKYIDLRGSTNKTLMWNAVATCLSYGYDGFHDDLEPYYYGGSLYGMIGTMSDYITYLNGVASTCDGAGKISSAAINCGYSFPVSTVYPYLTLTYIKPMLYNGGVFPESDFKARMDVALDYAAPDVILGLACIYPAVPLGDQFPWVDAQWSSGGPYDKLVGFAIFEWSGMDGDQWDDWDTWMGDNPEPTPTPTPTATPTPSPAPTPTPTTTPYPTPEAPLLGGDIITQDDFNLDFDSGESLVIQDTYNELNLTFTVSSGSLQGTGSLTVGAAGGTFTINPSSSGTLTITSTDSSLYIYVDGAHYTKPKVFSAGVSFTVTWNFYHLPPVIVSGDTYYFRSDSYQTNTVTAYGLDTDYTNTAVQLPSSGASGATVTYGFRVYQLHAGGSKTELTAGSPTATIALGSNSSGFQTATWSCTEHSWIIGKDALQVNVYVKFNSGEWTAVSNYVTPSILSNTLEASTWTFRVYLTYADNGETTETSFVFGSGTYKSSISGVSFSTPSIFELMLAALMNGDLILFFRLPLDLIFGAWWYFIIILAVSGAFYIRYRNITVILILFVLFGGTGGLVGALIPAPVDVAIWVLLALGLTGVLWRVFR